MCYCAPRCALDRFFILFYHSALIFTITALNMPLKFPLFFSFCYFIYSFFFFLQIFLKTALFLGGGLALIRSSISYLNITGWVIQFFNILHFLLLIFFSLWTKLEKCYLVPDALDNNLYCFFWFSKSFWLWWTKILKIKQNEKLLLGNSKWLVHMLKKILIIFELFLIKCVQTISI